MGEVKVTIYIPDFLCRFFVRLILIYRHLKYGYAFRKIELTQGEFAIVDQEDYEYVKNYKWSVGKKGKACYAYRMQKTAGGKHRQWRQSMHRLIMKAPPDMLVDHINHNGLDNRKANLPHS